jgi:hypothetical protein
MPLGAARTPTRTRAGQRRTRITLWSSEDTKDVILGQPEGDWEQFGTDDAAIEQVPFITNATEHGAMYRVTIKYRSDIIPLFDQGRKRMQIRSDTLTLTLLEIESPEQRNIDLVLHCAVA